MVYYQCGILSVQLRRAPHCLAFGSKRRGARGEEQEERSERRGVRGEEQEERSKRRGARGEAGASTKGFVAVGVVSGLCRWQH